MAGLFGFFNYEKEGPGVSKDAPKKRSFFRFFELYFRNFWKLLVNNLVYFVVSLPILTNGLAQAGITNIARSIAREKHSFGFADFKDTIKKNWKQGLALGIINTLIYALLIFDIVFLNKLKQSTFNTIYLGMIFAAFFIYTVMNFYMWTLMITFRFKIKQIFTNSLKFVIINLKYNFLCFFILVLVIALFLGILFLAQKFMIAYVLVPFLFICIYPGFKALLVQFCTFPCIKKCIIDPYYEEHPDADIEKRRSLGVLEEEDDEDVFSDEDEEVND